jgi:hypothetical protein
MSAILVKDAVSHDEFLQAVNAEIKNISCYGDVVKCIENYQEGKDSCYVFEITCANGAKYGKGIRLKTKDRLYSSVGSFTKLLLDSLIGGIANDAIFGSSTIQ